MNDENDKVYGVPRIVIPLSPPGPVEPVDNGGARSPRNEPTTAPGDPEKAGNLPYVMRTKRDGSIDPDDDTAPPDLSLAGTDTWERDNPPYRKTVAVSGVSATGNPTTITTAAHGIPSTIGGTVKVLLAGLTTTPDDANGLHDATYLSATEFTIAIDVTLADDQVGTAAILTSGVTINEEPRIYIDNGSGSFTQSIFTRQKKFDRFGDLYYVSAETLAEVDVESGSGSAGGGL